MSDATHSRGPWVIEYFSAKDSEYGENAMTCIMSCANAEGKEGFTVAEINRWSYGDDPPKAESEANAKLIAAAPELLEVCEAMLARLDYLHRLWGQEGISSRMADELRKVIAKAKGESQ